MIDVLGVRRVAILLILLVANGVMAAGNYMFLLPATQSQERKMNQQRSQSSKLASDIQRLGQEFEQLDQQKEEFETLQQRGLFDNQNRRNAQLIFEQIQKSSDVNVAKVALSSGTIEDDQGLKNIGYKVLSTPVSISVSSVSDLEIFRYVHLLKNFFPGHIAVDQFTLSRDAEISPTILRAMARPNKPSLVSANLKIVWRTIIPEDQVIDKGNK